MDDSPIGRRPAGFAAVRRVRAADERKRLIPTSTKVGRASFLLSYFEGLQAAPLAMNEGAARFSVEGANVKSNLHRSIVGAAGWSAALVIALTAGCAPSMAPANAARPESSREAAAAPARRSEPSSEREAIAQNQAQHAWCEYLQALYLRANAEASAWPRLAECVAVRSTASPEVLTQTADCALRALNTFEGDPFTPAYAGEVSRCGVAALNAATATRGDVEPFVATLCRRAVACGEASDAECHESFSPVVVMNLERAVGAMNRGGREQFRSCLRASSCEELSSRISTCLDPILDQLLWLPD
jgi:hypothetical protein